MLGCTLPKLVIIFFHKSIDSKICPVMDEEKDVKKLRKDIVGGPSVVFTRKAVADETFTRKSTKKSNILLRRMITSYTTTQLVNPHWPVLLPVGISIQRRVNSRLDKIRPAALKSWSSPDFQKQGQNVKLQASMQQAHKKRPLQCSRVLFTLQHCVRGNGLLLSPFPCQEVCPFLNEENIKRGSKKRELDELRRN